MERIYEIVLAVLAGSYLQAIGFWTTLISVGKFMLGGFWLEIKRALKAVYDWWNTEDDEDPPAGGPPPSVVTE